MPDASSEYRAYKLLQKIIVCCSVVILVAVFLLFLSAADKSSGRCEDIQQIRAYVLGATNRAITSLPTIAYYKEHPEERARALDNLYAQRDQFATPLDCSLF